MIGSSGGRSRSVLFLVVAALVVSSGTVASAAVQGETQSDERVLDRVVERYESAETVVASATVRTSIDGTTDVAAVSYASADPDSSRLVVERDGETYRSGSNGTVGWTVSPQGSAVWDVDSLGERSPSPFPGNDRTLDWAVPTDVDPANVSAERVGTESVNGTDAAVLELTPTGDTGGPIMTLWVAIEDYRVLRAETVDDDTRTAVDVRDVRFDVDIHESTFQPPSDRVASWSLDRYETFAAAEDDTRLDLPRLDGGTFTEATVTDQQDGTLVAQQYELDGENVTLVSTTATTQFERIVENGSTVEIDGREASVATMGDRSLVSWTDGDVTTIMVVEGPTDRAVEVASRVTA